MQNITEVKQIKELENLKFTKLYFSEDNFVLYHGDSLELLRKLPENSIDMIFADPPYFLSI